MIYSLTLQCSWLPAGQDFACTVEAADLDGLVGAAKAALGVRDGVDLVVSYVDKDFDEIVILEELDELTADATLVLRYNGAGAPPMRPVALPVAVSADTILLRIDAGELVPTESTLHLSGAEDLDGLAQQIGASLGLAGVKFLAWDDDFEEWCAPTDISELEGSASTRLKITAGVPAGTGNATAPAAVPTTAPNPEQTDPLPASPNGFDEGEPPLLKKAPGRPRGQTLNDMAGALEIGPIPPLALAPGGASHDSFDVSQQLGTAAGKQVEEAEEDRFEEVRVKKHLSDQLRQYAASGATAEELLAEDELYDVACFAWEGMLEAKPCAEIVKLWQRERTTAASIRMSHSLQLGMGSGFLGGAVDSIVAMSAPQVARLAAHSGWLAHEEKRKGAGFKRWTRKWIALVRSAGVMQHDEHSQLLLCFESAAAAKPEGVLRLARGCYTVAPPNQPRRNYPYCFRIDAVTPNNKAQSGKYLFAAGLEEEVAEWISQLQPGRHVARTRAEAKRELALSQQRSGRALSVLRSSFLRNGVRKTLAATGASMVLPSALRHGWELREKKASVASAGSGWRRCYCVLWRMPNVQRHDPYYLLYFADHASEKPDGWLGLSPGGYRLTTPIASKENEYTLRIDAHFADEGDSKLRLCFPTEAERSAWLEQLHGLFTDYAGADPHEPNGGGGGIWAEATSRLGGE